MQYIKSFILVAISVLNSSLAYAETYYVSPTGSASWSQCAQAAGGISTPCNGRTTFQVGPIILQPIQFNLGPILQMQTNGKYFPGIQAIVAPQQLLSLLKPIRDKLPYFQTTFIAVHQGQLEEIILFGMALAEPLLMHRARLLFLPISGTPTIA